MKLKLLLISLTAIIAGCAAETVESESEEPVEEVAITEEAEEESTESISETKEPEGSSDETTDEEKSKQNPKEDEIVSDEESLEENEKDELAESAQEEDAEAKTEENAVEEESDENQASIGDSKYIDILSPAFINEFFSGPESFIPHEISMGMSQSEIESIYGVHDTYYQMEGANIAIYGNVGLLYSEGFPAGEGGFPDIDPDNNFVTDTMIYMNVPHQTVVNTYGEPTVDYNEYVLRGPGVQSMIYDGTRDNGYAVFIEMSETTAMIMRKGEEWDLESLLETEERINEMQEEEDADKEDAGA